MTGWSVPPTWRRGTHITALGADGAGKQELDPQLFAVAAVRAVDSPCSVHSMGTRPPR